MANQKPSRTRDHSIDNIRLILISLVVFAHLLEVSAPFGSRIFIYNFIYSFHMPVFIFLFGYNVRFSLKRILCRWCIPYIIFQCVYLLFVKYVLKTSVTFQFATPYWLLWYMLTSIYYQLLLPILDRANKIAQVLLLAFAFALALLIGKVDSIGYRLSLSRTFVFLPWFVLGHYCKKNDVLQRLSQHSAVRISISVASLIAIVALSPYVLTLTYGILYSSCSYAVGGGTMQMRAIVFAMSAAVILFLFVGIKPYLNRKIPLLTSIGQNTWPVFLLHGFIVKAIPFYFQGLTGSPERVVLLTCAILVLLGNKWCNKAIYYACFSWIEKVLDKINAPK